MITLNHIHVIKHILEDLVKYTPEETLEDLYKQHIKDVAKRNIILFSALDISYHRKPASTIKIFKLQYLKPIIILKLCDTKYKKYLTDLSTSDMTYLLEPEFTQQQITELEKNVLRTIKRPHNLQRFRDIENSLFHKNSTETTQF